MQITVQLLPEREETLQLELDVVAAAALKKFIQDRSTNFLNQEELYSLRHLHNLLQAVDIPGPKFPRHGRQG